MPTYNRATQIPRTLNALLQQDYAAPYEIVIVDDGSRDDTSSVLAEYERLHPTRLRAFRQQNSGPARARNRGATEARGTFLAFLDDDCVPDRSWLRLLEESLEASGVDGVAGTVVNQDGSWIARHVNVETVIAHVLDVDGTVTDLITGNAGVRADVFRKLSGFDETIRVAGGEDTDFGYRMRAAGHKIAFAGSARVFHDGGPEGVGDYLRMIFRHGRGRRRLGERYPELRFSYPYLRLIWLSWPIRTWILRDYRRYRAAGVRQSECMKYLGLRYLSNIVRVAGYIRGT